jgi:hypothetical protein
MVNDKHKTCSSCDFWSDEPWVVPIGEWRRCCVEIAVLVPTLVEGGHYHYLPAQDEPLLTHHCFGCNSWTSLDLEEAEWNWQEGLVNR